MMESSKLIFIIISVFLLTGCPRGVEVNLNNASAGKILLEKNGGEKLIEKSDTVIIPEGRSNGLPLGMDGLEQLRFQDEVGQKYCFSLLFSHVPNTYFSNGSPQKITLKYRGEGVIWIEPYNKQAVSKKEGLRLPACN
jgi:hypothetical protein